ncbi:MAG TPA: hypothetical protein PKC96_04505 [Bacilli bacterium]|nr:hypothetical protein [Bacilli bacterium]
MDNDKMASHFTDEIYASKSEVQRELNTTLVDGVWEKIINYRAPYTHELPLRMVTREPIKVVLTPRLVDDMNRITLRLTSLARRTSRLGRSIEAYSRFRQMAKVDILSQVAMAYGLKTDVNLLYLIAENNISTLKSEDLILLRYNSVIDEIQKQGSLLPSASFFANLFFILDGSQPSSTFYRKDEIADSREQAQVNRIYIHAPTTRIEDMMEGLFALLSDGSQPVMIKLATAIFYSSYIAPFSYHSEIMAVILGKMVLASEEFDDIASLINLEKVFGAYKAKFEEASLQTKKNGDLTYVISLLNPIFDEIIASLSTFILKDERQMVADESYAVDELSIEVHNQARDDVALPSQDQASILPRERFINRDDINFTERLTEHSGIENDVRLALEHLPVGLDESDAQKLEQHLLELDPNLKRGEASFYARHCTIGKFYTIAQYKRLLKCAYETARTAMDHLAMNGYYRKEQLKNKFIYTPIPRR